MVFDVTGCVWFVLGFQFGNISLICTTDRACFLEYLSVLLLCWRVCCLLYDFFINVVFFSWLCLQMDRVKMYFSGFFSDTITTWWCIKTDSGLVYHKRENRLIFEKKNENWWALKTQKETLKSLWRQCSHYQQSIVERICGRSETVKEWWAIKVMGKKMMCANVVNDEGYWLGGGR